MKYLISIILCIINILIFLTCFHMINVPDTTMRFCGFNILICILYIDAVLIKHYFMWK